MDNPRLGVRPSGVVPRIQPASRAQVPAHRILQGRIPCPRHSPSLRPKRPRSLEATSSGWGARSTRNRSWCTTRRKTTANLSSSGILQRIWLAAWVARYKPAPAWGRQLVRPTQRRRSPRALVRIKTRILRRLRQRVLQRVACHCRHRLRIRINPESRSRRGISSHKNGAMESPVSGQFSVVTSQFRRRGTQELL